MQIQCIQYYYISYCKIFAKHIYHILVDNIAKILPCDKLLVLFRIIRGIMFISLGFTRMTQSGWKSKIINYFRDVIRCLSVNARKITSWISRKLGGLNCFIEYLHRKLLTANFLSYDIEIVKFFYRKGHLLFLHIKTINVLFYNFVFNSSQKWPTMLVQIR
jgi:hypothetical protein